MYITTSIIVFQKISVVGILRVGITCFSYELRALLTGSITCPSSNAFSQKRVRSSTFQKNEEEESKRKKVQTSHVENTTPTCCTSRKYY